MGSSHILIVDDDPALNAVFAELLRRAGHQVLTATSAEQALQLVDSNKIAVIVTDLYMPGMRGTELLTAVAAAGHHIPGILITGSGEHADSFDGFPGVSAVLIKPIDRNTLLTSINAILPSQSKKKVEPTSLH